MTSVREETRALANVVKRMYVSGMTHPEIALALDIRINQSRKLAAKADYRGPEWPKLVTRVWHTGSAIVMVE